MMSTSRKKQQVPPGNNDEHLWETTMSASGKKVPGSIIEINQQRKSTCPAGHYIVPGQCNTNQTTINLPLE